MNQNRSNLVPVQVVNKNGVLTTVHKKAAGATSTASAGIPPVTLSQRVTKPKKLSGMETLAAARSATANDLTSAFFFNRKRVGKRVQNSMVAEIHEDTLAILDKKRTVASTGVLSQVFHSCVEHKSFVNLNNLAVVCDLVDEIDKPNLGTFSSYIDGLQMYRMQEAPLLDWSGKSADEQEVPKALIRAAMRLEPPYVQKNAWVDGQPRHLVSDELVELIIKRPKDVGRIVDVIRDRNLPVDSEEGIRTLEGLLDQEAENPLMSGLL